MALGDGAEPGLVEVLTRSPLGLQLIAGKVPIFDLRGWDPGLGVEAALAPRLDRPRRSQRDSRELRADWLEACSIRSSAKTTVSPERSRAWKKAPALQPKPVTPPLASWRLAPSAACRGISILAAGPAQGRLYS
jgi:hypothetical protein